MPRRSTSSHSSPSCNARKRSDAGIGGRTFISARSSARRSSSDRGTAAASCAYSGISSTSMSISRSIVSRRVIAAAFPNPLPLL